MDHRPGGPIVPPCLHDHRAAGPAAVDVRRYALRGVAVGSRGEDLRHRAGLLVGGAAGGRLGEHRLGVRIGVALLLVGAETPVVALAHRLDGGGQGEDLEVALTVGAAAAAGVEEAQAARPRPAEARVLTPGEGGGAVRVGGDPGRDLVATRQLGLHRDLADPVLLEGLGVARLQQRVGVLLGGAVPPCALELALKPVGQAGRPRARGAVVLGVGHVGEVEQGPHVVDPVVQLLRAHARALDVARALGPAVAIDVQALIDGLQVALGEVVHVVHEGLVARPAPDEGHRAGELDRLVGVEVVGLAAVGVGGLRVVAEVDRPVRDGLVNDDARAVVEDVRDVAQRPKVVLGGLELAERQSGERRVLAIGGEDPRVVGEPRSEPPGVGHRSERGRELLALVGPADLQAGGALREVGQVLLAPLDGVLEQRIAGKRDVRPARQLLARGDLVRELAGGIGQRRGQLALGGAEALVRSRCRHPQRLARVRGDGDRVVQLAPGSPAEGTVVAGAGKRLVAVMADVGALRAAEGAPGVHHLVRRGILAGGDQRGIVMSGRAGGRIGGRPSSVNWSAWPVNAPWSGRLSAALGVTPLKPHG